MTIELKGEYKSLTSFLSDPLSNFTVITGRNGSGKTQLLELFNLNYNGRLPREVSFVIDSKHKNIRIGGIANSNLKALDNDSWKTRIEPYINRVDSVQYNLKKFASELIKYDVWIDQLTIDNIKEKIDNTTVSEEELKTFIFNILEEVDSQFIQRFPDASLEQIINRLFKNRFFSDIKKTLSVAQYVAKFQNKEISELSNSDFFLTPIPEYLFDDPKLFESRLEYVFYNYAKRRDQNRRLYFDKQVDGDSNDSISDKDFVEKFPPPWESINQILLAHNMSFQFQGIDKKEFSPEIKVSFQLIKTTVQKNISLQHLSSGEKVILGLIIKLFTSQYYQNKLILPDLIILDEPDAHLHPEMSKLLIEVLHDTFVNKLGIDVFMVTHSPSTIALSPDNSIYELKNVPKTTLKKIEKAEALEILTGNLPTLSIDYQNHKQVFVESPTDVRYYQTLFNKLNQYKNYPFKLYFISNSYGKGNCNQVITIVNSIRTSGNKTAFGIIDWDLKNEASTYVKVHGALKRYSIENYIYDPIYILILLMDLKANRIYKELELEETFNQYNLMNSNQEFLQKLTDWFFNKYYLEFNVSKSKKNDKTSITYLNGMEIQIPKWYLSTKGHDLELNIKKLFNSLENKFRSEGHLQKELILIMGKLYPLIPKDSEEIINSIINGG
ncbi:ATP-binding protein [Flavobacteriaceae bacterium TK19130]|nr:ATP-binding protein [Thermobacterium salinum]